MAPPWRKFPEFANSYSMQNQKKLLELQRCRTRRYFGGFGSRRYNCRDSCQPAAQPVFPDRSVRSALIHTLIHTRHKFKSAAAALLNAIPSVLLFAQVPQLRRNARRWIAGHVRQFVQRQPRVTLRRAQHHVAQHCPLQRNLPSPSFGICSPVAIHFHHFLHRSSSSRSEQPTSWHPPCGA